MLIIAFGLFFIVDNQGSGLNLDLKPWHKLELEKSFFDHQYESLDSKLYEKCSIDGWIEDLFFGEQDDCWNS